MLIFVKRIGETKLRKPDRRNTTFTSLCPMKNKGPHDKHQFDTQLLKFQGHVYHKLTLFNL